MRNRHELRKLGDDDLVTRTRGLVVRSNAVEADLLAHLAEVDRRKLYVPKGFNSMFAFCVSGLGFSEGMAYSRITVARASRRFPGTLEALRKGRVHLTGLCLLSKHLTEENVAGVLADAAGRSKQEIEEMVATLAPKPDVSASIRKVPSKGARAKGDAGRYAGTETAAGAGAGAGTGAAAGADAGAGTGAAAGTAATGGAGGAAGAGAGAGTDAAGGTGAAAAGAESGMENGRGHGAPGGVSGAGGERLRSSISPLSPERYKVQVTISRELRDKLDELRDLMAHQVPDRDLEQVLDVAVTRLLAEVKKTRFGIGRKPRRASSTVVGSDRGSKADGNVEGQMASVTPSAGDGRASNGDGRVSNADGMVSSGDGRPSRHVPAEKRREVYMRDAGRCTFVGEDGNQCKARTFVQIDHPDGFAETGNHDRLRLLCHAHNQYEAEQRYGKDFVEQKRRKARRCGKSTASRSRKADTVVDGRAKNDVRGKNDARGKNGRARHSRGQDPPAGS